MKTPLHTSYTMILLTLVALATPILGQDERVKASESPPLSLSAAVEAAKRGEFGDEARERLAAQGRLAHTMQAGYVSAEFTLDGAVGLVTSEKLSAGRVEVSAQVAGISFDGLYDRGESAFHLDGHGHSISDEARVFLQAFAFRLSAENWDSVSGDRPIEKRLAFRLINFLSEAPVGYRFNAHTIPLPEPARSGGDANKLENSSVSRPSQRERLAGETSSFNCNNVNGQDGVIYRLCNLTADEAWHDACDQHGYESRTELAGCSQNHACLGRCGGGCGGDGAGVYSKDCAEHDSCCREHGGCFNPGDVWCGDEYADAADDFFAGYNCPGCGGGGGGGGCSPVENTRTWVIGPTGEPRLASEQLQFGLERVDRRPETTIYLEEWAVLSVEEGRPEVRRSSTPTFGMQVAANAHGFAPADGSTSTLLIVESAEHPLNARHIPTPMIARLDTMLNAESLDEDQEFLFRAEVAATGVVDDVTLLDASALLPSDEVRKAIAADLHLQYADIRRHRSVVHARGTLTSGGRMVVEHGLVIVVMCCCDDDCCFDPEWEIWLCPCGQPCQPT